MTRERSESDVATELEDLRSRLAEAEAALRSIRGGEVDAIVVGGSGGDQIYSLADVDRVYRHLVEGMSEGAVTVSADGVILYCNSRFALMLGRSLDEVIGTAMHGCVLPADGPVLDAILAQASTASCRRELTLQTRDGGGVPVYLSASRLRREGAQAVYCLVATDLTGQRQQEHIVAEERLARLILERAADAIVVCDEQGQVIRASQAAEQLCDKSPLLRPFAEAFPLRDGTAELFQIASVLHGPTLRNVDVVLERPGQRFDLILNAGPLLEGQQVLGCVVSLTDISERKQAEYKRVQLEEQLRAAQKMEAIGSLAGGVAHDFNNLLTVILSYAGFAMAGLPDGDPSRSDLREVQKAAERAVALTRQLLAFSRKQVLQPVALCLNQSAAGVEPMLRRILGEDIELVETLAPDLGLTMADPGQIEQVLMNLVVNARDAMPTGGKLLIQTSNVELDEEYAARHVAAQPGSYVQLAVSDTGCGMSAQTVAHIYEPFFTTKEKGKGTGLGLSTVYGIVKQSGGNIWVYSELGHGTTFRVYLPREFAASVAPLKVAPALRASTGTETILVAEDEVALRQVTRRALEVAGYTVLTATDGDEALRVGAQHEGDIHLLVTDVVMPHMGGRVLAQELCKARPAIKVLYTSGYTDDAIVHHGVLDAGTHFLPKPFVAADLTRKVREVLDEGDAGLAAGRGPADEGAR